MQNHLAHKIHIFCPIEINEINRAENVNFVCQMVLQVFSYKKTDFRLRTRLNMYRLPNRGPSSLSADSAIDFTNQQKKIPNNYSYNCYIKKFSFRVVSWLTSNSAVVQLCWAQKLCKRPLQQHLICNMSSQSSIFNAEHSFQL